jgi:Ser/Thr protein kinase RdoA (MazF antagonist)
MDVFWFHEGDESPRVVTKISRDRSRGEREFANLQQVYHAAPKWVPKPLYFGEHGGLWTLWMEGVAGGAPRGGVTGDTLRSMCDVVTGIHQSLRKTSGRKDRYQQIVIDPLRSLAEFGDSARVVEGCRRVLERAHREWFGGMPAIPQHGDLYPGNLLVKGGEWHVVDWEGFGLTDLPAYDLYTLLVSLLWEEGNTSDRWTPGLTCQIPAVIKAYSARIGLQAADMRLLLPLALANWFHLQWRDGREKFAGRLYQTMEDYFARESSWERIFFPV